MKVRVVVITPTKETVEKLIYEFEKRVLSDAVFQQLCLDDPAQAVRELCGVGLCASFVLSTEKDKDGEVTLMLQFVLKQEDELAESQLDHVTGGRQIQGFNTENWSSFITSKRVKLKVDMPWGIAGSRG